MRVFVTGATGYVGTAVVMDLIAAGHQVLGLARTKEGAARLVEAGAEAHCGTLDDLDSLRGGAAAADGVIHLAFKHDFTDFSGSLAADLRAVEALGAAMIGSGKPLIVTAHFNGKASDDAALALADRGVRSAIVELPPSVHSECDRHGMVPQLIAIARAKGVSAYVGDGSNRWPAIHLLDAARLFRLALEAAPAGSRLQGVGDKGVPFRDIAGLIGRKLNLPVVSLAREDAQEHFGFLGLLAGADIPKSGEVVQRLLNWQPELPGLIAELEQDHYFRP
ncbi:SDR family oxidoreductase [Paenibacillus athensensis]|uniref:3-beta hydroxysteroid dehydrogenase n=1 Tax=Paenibacillus athensensis TaxID=1967502 RepID=A0A4Y8Q411_9BACL|nr:SDR family oxidoreductase [Paenibacillus athensensis]MCD1258425.1 SDR family oxidoreductase [Paenibacillus athensensis]